MEMYREDGKSTNHIYENYNVTRVTSEKEITDCNATRIQSSELTGADGVKIRSFRAAVVCLVLLCVLLLTAVIVLCVMFTQDRQQFISKNNNLTDERDQLIFMNENLTRARDQLKQEKNDLQRSLGKMDGWTCYQSSLYFISSESKSWNESRRYCRDRGADLIIINNRDEQEFVNMIPGAAGLWLGLSEVNGTWKWVDGSALNSGLKSPNGYTGQYCIVRIYSQLYYDPCDHVYRWICEKNILPNVLT